MFLFSFSWSSLGILALKKKSHLSRPPSFPTMPTILTRRRRGLSFFLFLCTRNFYFTTGEGKVSSVGCCWFCGGIEFSRLVILLVLYAKVHAAPKIPTGRAGAGNFPRKAPRSPPRKISRNCILLLFFPLILQRVSELISFPLCLSPSSHGHARILLPRTNTRDGDTNVLHQVYSMPKGWRQKKQALG